MTSRRALATYAQRTSRALQFVPGHVGGRVDSAQPVNRYKGTAQRAAGTLFPPDYAYPDWHESVGNGYQFDVGGTMKEICSDRSDATYFYTVAGGILRATLVEFEPYSPPPGRVILSIELTFRAYLDIDNVNRISHAIWIGADIRGTDPDVISYAYWYGAIDFVGTYTNYSFDLSPLRLQPDDDYATDREHYLADIAAGRLQMIFSPDYDPPYNASLYFSEMRLTIVTGPA